MVSAIDGAECQPSEISVRPEDYSILKQRLLSILRGLEQLHQVSSLCCLTCSAISRRMVQHVGGCPATFNLCFKCLGAHHGQSCTGQYFNVKKKFCFKCWMPAFDLFGISFHGNSKEELVRCNNAARNFLKPLAMCFYHKRITLYIVNWVPLVIRGSNKKIKFKKRTHCVPNQPKGCPDRSGVCPKLCQV